MLLEALEELIGCTIPAGYEPLAYVIASFCTVWLLTEFLRMIRTILIR